MDLDLGLSLELWMLVLLLSLTPLLGFDSSTNILSNSLLSFSYVVLGLVAFFMNGDFSTFMFSSSRCYLRNFVSYSMSSMTFLVLSLEMAFKPLSRLSLSSSRHILAVYSNWDWDSMKTELAFS